MMYTINIKKNDNMGMSIWLSMACILVNFSQLPFFTDHGLTRYLNMPVWICVMTYVLVQKRRISIHKNTVVTLFIFSIILFFCMLFQVNTGHQYLTASVITCMMMSIVMLIVGDISGTWLDESTFKCVLFAYAASAFVVSIQIFLQYFSGDLGLDSRVYVFDSKNSFGQIAFNALVIFYFFNTKGKKLLEILRILSMSFLLFFIMILRSRATILGLITCVVFMALARTKNRRIKRAIWMAIIISVVALATSETLRKAVFDQILFAGRDLTDLNDLSSGRVSIIQSFPILIEGNWFTGIGNKYFECFPLSAILNLGILVGTLLLYLAYNPFIISFRNRTRSEYCEGFFYIALGYAVNSIFEGLAPIGPGAKCYILWLIFGILQNDITGHNLNDEY